MSVGSQRGRARGYTVLGRPKETLDYWMLIGASYAGDIVATAKAIPGEGGCRKLRRKMSRLASVVVVERINIMRPV